MTKSLRPISKAIAKVEVFNQLPKIFIELFIVEQLVILHQG